MTSSILIKPQVVPMASVSRMPSSALQRPGDAETQEAETLEPIPQQPTRSAARPAPGWWEGVAWTVALVVLTQVVPLAFLILLAMAGAGPETFAALVVPGLFCGQILGVGLGVLALRVRLGPDWMKAIHLRRPALLPCLCAVLCLPAFLFVAGHATMLLQHIVQTGEPSRQLITHSTAQHGLWFSMLVVAVGAAVNEELFCRGFLGRGLVGRYGVFFGVLLTSVLFGVMHFSIVQGFFAFLLGCYVHMAYVATRSLWVPILLHFLNNLVATLLVSLAPEAMDMQPTVWGIVAHGVVVIALAVPCIWALYRHYKRQAAETRIAAAPEAPVTVAKAA